MAVPPGTTVYLLACSEFVQSVPCACKIYCTANILYRYSKYVDIAGMYRGACMTDSSLLLFLGSMPVAPIHVP